jgi:hypothetical protein
LAALAGASVAIVVPYLITIGGPLRLAPDSVAYLANSLHIAPPPHHQTYPQGYPVLLRLVEHIGLGSAWGFTAVSMALLAVGLTLAYRLCRDPLDLSGAGALVVCLAVLLAHPFSQLAPAPLSEIPYFAVAMACLLVLTTAERRSGWPRARLVILAAVLAAVGVTIRVAALALVPPVLFVAIGPSRLVSLWRVGRRRPAAAIPIAAASVLALIAVAVVVIEATPYAHHIAYVWRKDGGLGPFLDRVGIEARTKIMSLGNLAGQSRCCGPVPVGRDPAFVAGGIAVLALVGLGWWTRRRAGAIEIFVLSTAAVILVYAGAAPRFWMAALPFMFAYGWFGAKRLMQSRIARTGFALFAIAFTLTGAVYLIQNVEMSTSESSFLRLWVPQVQPWLGASYRVAFGHPRPGDPSRVNPTALYLLRRYEPLARNPGVARSP